MTRMKFLQRRQLMGTAILIIAIPLVCAAILRGRSASLLSSADNTQLEVELVTLRPAGFEPSELTRPKGAFVLFVDDRSGRESSLLLLQRANSERLRAINIQRKKSDWNDVVDLTPGTYVLQDANRSELRCQITILP